MKFLTHINLRSFIFSTILVIKGTYRHILPICLLKLWQSWYNILDFGYFLHLPSQYPPLSPMSRTGRNWIAPLKYVTKVKIIKKPWRRVGAVLRTGHQCSSLSFDRRPESNLKIISLFSYLARVMYSINSKLTTRRKTSKHIKVTWHLLRTTKW